MTQTDQIEVVDPTPLVKSLYERLWIETGAQEERCLYNVVEILVLKLLSDIGAVNGHHSFQHLLTLLTDGGEEAALTHYASVSRPEVRGRFPQHSEGHKIKATVFIEADGQPNLQWAWLFGEVLRAFHGHEEEHGTLRNVERQFKARVYEAFLQQQAGIRLLTSTEFDEQLKWFPPTSLDRG